MYNINVSHVFTLNHTTQSKSTGFSWWISLQFVLNSLFWAIIYCQNFLKI